MSGGAKGATRALEIIDHIASLSDPASSAQLCGALALPRSSAHDLLRGLHRRRFLARTSDGQWTLGQSVQRLALTRYGLGHVTERLVPSLDILAQQTDAIAQLSVLEGCRQRILYSRGDTRSARPDVMPGAELPVSWTAAGLVLVAGLDGPGLRRVLTTRTLSDRANEAMPTADEFVREVIEARRRGYAIETGRMHAGGCSIAAPVIDSQGRCLAAISLVLPVARMLHSRDTLIALVRAAAARLTPREP